MSNVAAGPFHHTIELQATDFPIDRMEARASEALPFNHSELHPKSSRDVVSITLHCDG
ncbi:MAG: hypothetical protein R3E08_12650 [Thiotrichaceae bacterium]